MTIALPSAYPLASARAEAVWCSRSTHDSRTVEADVAVRDQQREQALQRRTPGRQMNPASSPSRTCNVTSRLPHSPSIMRRARCSPGGTTKSLGYLAGEVAVDAHPICPKAISVESLPSVQPDDAPAPRSPRRFAHKRGLPSPRTTTRFAQPSRPTPPSPSAHTASGHATTPRLM